MADEATASAVASRADRFSRISAIARRDVERYGDSDGGTIFTPGAAAAAAAAGASCSASTASSSWGAAWEPPWIARRRRRESEVAEAERLHQQMVEVAVGIGQQVDVMGRQLEEQNRQLKALAAGHTTQTNIQQQVVALLAEVQAKQQQQQQNPKPSRKRPSCAYYPTTHGHTPQEYHTLTWLHNNHPRQQAAGKHYRHPAHGFSPLRRSSPLHSDHHRNTKFDSASDRTKTTFGGTRRRSFRRSPPKSIPTEPPPDSYSVGKEKKASPKKSKKKKVPLVAVLYEKCKRKASKKRSKSSRQVAPSTAPPSASSRGRNVDRHCEHHHLHDHHDHHDQHVHHNYSFSLEGKRHEEHPTNGRVKQRLEDRILESMLAVQKHEDEFKQRWLVSEQDDVKSIGRAILEELTKHSSNASSPRKFNYAVGNNNAVRSLVLAQDNTLEDDEARHQTTTTTTNSQTKEDPMLIEESQQRTDLQTNEDTEVEAEDLIVDIILDELAEEISVELLCFCNEFVEHIYSLEFINAEAKVEAKQ